jgi:hypothetical protein
MTATITPTTKERHRAAPAVVPMVLLAIALLLGVTTIARPPAPVAPQLPVAVRTVPATAPAATVPTTAVPVSAPAPTVPPTGVPVAAVTTTPAVSTGCADAVAYIAGHAAPGYVTTCAPGSALGHYGSTCANVPGRCDDVRIIHVACPAPFVYMNEAHNSWVVLGQGSGIDPYGQGTAAEQSYCDGFR